MPTRTVCNKRRSRKVTLDEVSRTSDDSGLTVSITDIIDALKSTGDSEKSVDMATEVNMLHDLFFNRPLAEEVGKCFLEGRPFNALDYFDSNTLLYRLGNPIFQINSSEGYFVGRCFLTNQPIFRPYKNGITIPDVNN